MTKKFKSYQRNLKNEDGAVAVLVTFLIIAIMGFAALVIDFGGAYLTRVRFQQAVDAASRAASRALVQSQGLSNSQMQTLCQNEVNSYLQKNGFPEEKIQDLKVIVQNGDTVEVDATTRYNYNFAKVIYSSYADIKAEGASKTDVTVIEGDKLTVDVVFVLDISGSMFNDTNKLKNKFIPMVNAVNQAIKSILTYNPQNRVGVVVFSGMNEEASGYTKTLLELTNSPRTPMANGGISGSYQSSTYAAPTYIGYKYNTSRNAVKIVISGADGSVCQSVGGTFTQAGICKGAQLLVNAKKDVIRRVPAMFILSDGEATWANTDYTNPNIVRSNIGSGSAANWNNEYFVFQGSNVSYLTGGAIGAYTVKTASYWKDQITTHYTQMYGEPTQCSIYSLGFDLNDTTFADFAEGVLNPNYLYEKPNEIWSNPAKKMKSYLNGGLYFWDNSDVRYADKFYRAVGQAELAEALRDFSKDVVEPIKLFSTRLTK